MPKNQTGNPEHFSEISSDCTTKELVALYSAIRRFSPRATVCDVGCGNGGSTAAICQGLLDAGIEPRQQVYAYDLFEELPSKHASTAAFNQNTKPYAGYISQIQVDLLNVISVPESIDILFIDAAKTSELNRAIVRAFIPQINTPSLIINQDFGRPHLYWIHLMFSHLIESGAKYEIVDDMIVTEIREDISDILLSEIIKESNDFQRSERRLETLRRQIGKHQARNNILYRNILLLSLCSLCATHGEKDRALDYLTRFRSHQKNVPRNLIGPIRHIENQLQKL